MKFIIDNIDVKSKDGKYAYCVLYTTGEDIDWKEYKLKKENSGIINK